MTDDRLAERVNLEAEAADAGVDPGRNRIEEIRERQARSIRNGWTAEELGKRHDDFFLLAALDVAVAGRAAAETRAKGLDDLRATSDHDLDEARVLIEMLPCENDGACEIMSVIRRMCPRCRWLMSDYLARLHPKALEQREALAGFAGAGTEDTGG